jgi:hypothetical protein
MSFRWEYGNLDALTAIIGALRKIKLSADIKIYPNREQRRSARAVACPRSSQSFAAMCGGLPFVNIAHRPRGLALQRFQQMQCSIS